MKNFCYYTEAEIKMQQNTRFSNTIAKHTNRSGMSIRLLS